MGGGGNRGGGGAPPPYIPPVQAAPVARPKATRKGSYRGANILTDQSIQLGTAPTAKQTLGV